MLAAVQKFERIAEGILVQKTRRHMTWSQVADILGFSRQALQQRLVGKVKWKFDELDKLAAAWHITVEHIADGFGENYTDDPEES